MLSLGPIDQRRGDLDGNLVPRDMRAGRVVMQACGYLLAPQTEDRFDHPSDARRRFGMADIGFDGTDPQGSVQRTPTPVNLVKRIHFDGIAQAGAGAVGFDAIDFQWGEFGVLQRLANHFALRGSVGRGEAITAAIVIDGGSLNQRQDAVTVALRVRETFQEQDAAAFAAPIAVGGSVEGFTAAIGRERLYLGQRDETVER